MTPLLKTILIGGVVILIAVATLHANHYASQHGAHPMTFAF